MTAIHQLFQSQIPNFDFKALFSHFYPKNDKVVRLTYKIATEGIKIAKSGYCVDLFSDDLQNNLKNPSNPPHESHEKPRYSRYTPYAGLYGMMQEKADFPAHLNPFNSIKTRKIILTAL
jgi:hypothetical protein